MGPGGLAIVDIADKYHPKLLSITHGDFYSVEAVVLS